MSTDQSIIIERPETLEKQNRRLNWHARRSASFFTIKRGDKLWANGSANCQELFFK
jgi:hypothetical protein